MLEVDGFVFEDTTFVEKNDFYRPVADKFSLASSIVNEGLAVERVAKLLKIDIDGQPRENPSDVGADQLGVDEPANIYPLTPGTVGPKSYSNSRI